MGATYTYFFFIKLKKIFNVALKENIFHGKFSKFYLQI